MRHFFFQISQSGTFCPRCHINMAQCGLCELPTSMTFLLSRHLFSWPLTIWIPNNQNFRAVQVESICTRQINNAPNDEKCTWYGRQWCRKSKKIGCIFTNMNFRPVFFPHTVPKAFSHSPWALKIGIVWHLVKIYTLLKKDKGTHV